jgi:hypothetical protein
MDQPTAEEALKRLEPLVGEWTLEAKPPDGPPRPGEAHPPIWRIDDLFRAKVGQWLYGDR